MARLDDELDAATTGPVELPEDLRAATRAVLLAVTRFPEFDVTLSSPQGVAVRVCRDEEGVTAHLVGVGGSSSEVRVPVQRAAEDLTVQSFRSQAAARPSDFAVAVELADLLRRGAGTRR